MADDITPFQMSRISVSGDLGAGVIVAVLVGAMLADLPPLRGPALGALAGGLILAAALILWHSRKPLDGRTPPVSLDLSEGRRRPR